MIPKMDKINRTINVISQYTRAATVHGDIHEHIPTLMRYASQCETIVECGVRSVVSSWAFATGLYFNSSETKRLYGVDLEYHPNIGAFRQAVADVIDYSFWEGNDLDFDCPQVDMTFIDSFHHYRQMEAELKKYAPLTTKWIIGHDCQSDRMSSELVRQPHMYDIYQVSKQTGWSVEDLTVGIWPAVMEFLETHPEWILKEEFTNNNGLFVLERVSPIVSDPIVSIVSDPVDEIQE